MSLFTPKDFSEVTCTSCGAKYKRCTVELPVKDTDRVDYQVCGARLESWIRERHVPNYTLLSTN